MPTKPLPPFGSWLDYAVTYFDPPSTFLMTTPLDTLNPRAARDTIRTAAESELAELRECAENAEHAGRVIGVMDCLVNALDARPDVLQAMREAFDHEPWFREIYVKRGDHAG